ncbi:MAG TPA: signal recognition particle protein [Candidatus Brocadiia bacterium]|nr:signal recognition particle protein [Candidatus Brocadiia bacterium]
MFESLSKSLEKVFERMRGKPRLTEENVQEALREVRLALLEADVSYKVVRDFLGKVTERALGAELIKSVTPGQQFVKIVHDELEALMGEGDSTIPYRKEGLTVLMLVGLQGSGKTTTCAKLAMLVRQQKHRPMLVAADVQRPAAIDQLETLGRQLDVPVHLERGGIPPLICKQAVAKAGELNCDVVILDTAGRLHIDLQMMNELKDIVRMVKPDQTFLVCDAMTGQDAVNSAGEFNQQLPVDGVILTKLDGDARGGAALSIRSVTGKPIKFIGIGEKLDKLEPFHPDRMATRILGMGDVVSLVEKAQDVMAEEEAEELERKLRTERFDLEDFLKQIQALRRMGPLKDIMGMLPFFGNRMSEIEIDESGIDRVEAIICSMTRLERSQPEIIDSSRRQRIAQGSGTDPQDINRLLKQFKQMRKLLFRMTGPKGEEMLEAMTGGMQQQQEIGPGVGRAMMDPRRRKLAREKRKKSKRRRHRH